MVINAFDPVGPEDGAMFETILLLDEGQVISIGWIEVVLAWHELEDNRILLGLKEHGFAEIERDEYRASYESILLEL